MKRKIATPIILVLITLLISSCNNKKDDKLISFLETQLPKNDLGAVINASVDGNNKVNLAFGLANIEDQNALDEKMVFPIASMTKAYTAVAIMQLHEEQLLNIEDSITKYLTGFPGEYNKVKIKQLLSNTSGVPSYNRMPEYRQTSNKDTLSLNSMLSFIKNKPLSFLSGERFSYSNSNYILLTKIIETVGKTTYTDYVKLNILQKAGLTETFFKNQQTSPIGYEYGNDTIKRNSENTQHTFGAGMLYATASDVVKFLNALSNEKLISRQSLDFIYSVPLIHNDGRPDEYAHGFWITDFNGEKVIKMEGYCTGFYTMAFFIPNRNIAITVFPNSSGYPFPINQTFIAQWIYRHIIGKKAEVYMPITLKGDVLKKYEGVYQIDSVNYRQVFVEKNTLYTMRNGGQNLASKAYGSNKFFYPNTFTSFEFVEENGKLKMLMNDDNSVESTAIITGKSIRKSVEINKDVLEQYVGKYEKRFQIYTENSELMFTNGFHTYQLYPLSENEFYPHHEDAVFSFNKENNEMHLTYSIGEFTMSVKKIVE